MKKLAELILRSENISENVCREIKTHFKFMNIFFKILLFFKKIWKKYDGKLGNR